MAIQNFVSGGFYGKVGEFVGQRWKNIRTIRAYVIPHNPRTPNQQANRKFFGTAVPLAQLANSAYPKCPAFDTSTNTQWAYRMSIAKLAVEAGEQDVATVPIFPKNFIAPFTVTGVTVNAIENTRQITISIQGNLPDVARNYSAILYFASGSRVGEMIVCSGKSSSSDPNTILLECGDTLEIDSAQIFCRVFSNDDKTAETIIGCARLELQKNLSRKFNTSTDLEEFTVNNDGTITAIYKTPNAWESGVSGNVSASLALASCSRSFKDGTSSEETANIFAVVANLENVGGSVGVKCVFTPSAGQNICLSYMASGNLNITYNNVSTPSTEPSTETKTLNFAPTWNNVQPIFKLSDTFLENLSNSFEINLESENSLSANFSISANTNPTSENDKAFMNANMGKGTWELFEADGEDAPTYRIKGTSPTFNEVTEWEETELDGQRITSETGRYGIEIDFLNYNYNKSGLGENTNITSVTLEDAGNIKNIVFKVKGFYTDDTRPASEDLKLNIENQINNPNLDVIK